jgi:hypothetical protein
MAKKKAEESKSEGKGKSKKYLAIVAHHRMPDGTFVHKHSYKDSKDSEEIHPPRLMGTSPTLEDVKQHLDDHWGDEEGAADPEAGDQQAGDEDQQADAQPGPAAAAAQGGTPPDEEEEA